MKYLLFYILTLGVVVISCADKKPAYQTITTPTGTWELVWDEEFDYEGFPDSTKWSYDTKGNATGWGNNEAQFYTEADKNNAWVSNGLLTITALKQQMEGKEYTLK